MTISYTGDRSPLDNGTKTAGVSHAASPSANLNVDDIVLVHVAFENVADVDGETDHLSCADDNGNTWTKIREYQRGGGGANDGALVAVFLSKITTQITTSDQITVTCDTSVGAKAFGITAWGVDAGNTLEETDWDGASFNNDTDLTISGLSSAEYLMLMTSATETNSEPLNSIDSDYTKAQADGTSGGSGTTNMWWEAAYRIATLTSDTYSVDISPNRDTAAVLIAFSEVSAGGGETASVSPVTVPISLPSVTATYEEQDSASVSPVTVPVALPSVVASYVQEETAAVSPVTVPIVLPSVTASATAEAAVSPVAVPILLPTVTATYEEQDSAAVSPVSVPISLPTVTATYQEEDTATVSPVTVPTNLPAVTATTGAEAAVSPVSVTLSLPAVTATYQSELDAAVAPAEVPIVLPAVAASYVYEVSAVVSPVTVPIALPSVTATTAVAPAPTPEVSPSVGGLLITLSGYSQEWYDQGRRQVQQFWEEYRRIVRRFSGETEATSQAKAIDAPSLAEIEEDDMDVLGML